MSRRFGVSGHTGLGLNTFPGMSPEVRPVIIHGLVRGSWLGLVFCQDSPVLTQGLLMSGGQVSLTHSNRPPFRGVQELMESY